MRIAIVGTGVAGLGAAYALRSSGHDVVVVEADHRPGGHANTVDIDYEGTPIAVDTGFIVFNALTYPNLIQLLAELDVPTFDTDMSFACAAGPGREWSSNGLNGIFAWRRNALNPFFIGMLADITRFSLQARRDADAGTLAPDLSLEAYVTRLNLGDTFKRDYLAPMAAAIWSSSPREIMAFPAASFLRFFNNHRLLHAKRPMWRTIKGGSRTYVSRIAGLLGNRLRLGHRAVGVETTSSGIEIRFDGQPSETFDRAILACHSDQALALLHAPSPEVSSILSAIRYAPNTAYLHRDKSLMPQRPAAYAAWNYMQGKAHGARPDAPAFVSYWMNTLQDLPRDKPLFVTLNPTRPPDPDLTFGSFSYAHPQFDAACLSAQGRLDEIQGKNGIYYAGAWAGYGFHEDGLASGYLAAARLGAKFATAPDFSRLGCAALELGSAIGPHDRRAA